MIHAPNIVPRQLNLEPEDDDDNIQLEKTSSYHGNNNLKPVGFQYDFTKEQIEEIIKCKNDPLYFIETYCHIVTLDEGLQLFVPYQVQRDQILNILNERKVIVRQPRQTGKSVTSAACILWYTLFQERKTVAILANKGSAAREVLSRYQIMYEHLPIWLQQGVKTWNKGDIELENGSKIFASATSASAIRGKSVNWLYIDEAAIVPNNIAEEFFASVYPTISSGKTTKILITSTPLGYNHFWKFWNEAEKGVNGFLPIFIPYWEFPGRDEEWAEEQRRNLGDLKFNQEVSCEFLGSSNTLISGRVLATLSSTEPEFTSMNMDIFKKPVKGRTYVLVADTARGVGLDYSAFTVIDVTEAPYEVVAKYRDNEISPMLFPNYIWKAAVDYNEAFVLVESNDIGREVVDILQSELEYENLIGTVTERNKTIVSAGFGKTVTFGVKTTKSVKRIGCFALKSLIEERKLLVFDADTIQEMSTYIQKNNTFNADEGEHDDLVMTLVLFAWLTTNQYFKDLTDINIRQKTYHKQMEQIADGLTPFGFSDDGINEQENTFVSDGVVWSFDQSLPWKP